METTTNHEQQDNFTDNKCCRFSKFLQNISYYVTYTNHMMHISLLIKQL